MTGIYLFDDLKEIIPFNHSKGSHSYLNQVMKTLGDPIYQNWEPIHEFHRDEDYGNYFCSSGKDCIILPKCGIVIIFVIKATIIDIIIVPVVRQRYRFMNSQIRKYTNKY